MLIFKILILLLCINFIYSLDFLNDIKNIQYSMLGFEKYGCKIVFSNTLNQVDKLRVIIDQYLNNYNCNDTRDMQYRFVVESLKPKLDSLSNEADYLLGRCTSKDYDSRPLSLERPPRLQQFLQEWNSTLRYLGESIESKDYILKPLVVIQSNSMNYFKDSELNQDFYNFRDCQNSYCPEMVVIPKGSFIMGATDKEHKDLGVSSDISEWDQPQHKVTIKKRFAIGKYEITLKQFREFVKETGHKIPKGCITIKTSTIGGITGSRLLFTDFIDYENLGEGFDTKNENQPVLCVRIEDARNFAIWLSRKTNQVYRLPYEAEWEYVTRANQGYQYYIWGNETNDDSCKYANVYDLDSKSHYNFTFQNFKCKDGFISSSPVGSFLPNQFGIHDLLANAREWVDDCWHYGFKNAPSDGSRWGSEDNGLCNFGVLRGGSFFYNTFNTRIAYRNAYFSSQSKSYMWGFRLVREIKQY